ncbi:MAG TPA: cysteine synthase A [Clostridiaceae bacterium]|jgi:cysteine synthase A|nr:cysteine synthase A [Clostridiaceae bacterium]
MNYNLLNTIGNSPLIDLNRLGFDRIYVKLEKTNPAGSIKDRPAYYMLKSAIDSGDLKPGMTVIEPTSGNMGIALAMLGSQLGLKVILVMPDTMSVERRNLIKAYGAELLLTPGAEGMAGAEKKAAELVAAKGYFMPNQFNNPNNPLAHEKTTGIEIINALPDIAGFVAGIGTGGTITGVGKALKKHNTDIKIWAMEPAESPLITEGHSGSHNIQGIGANFIPQNLDLSLIDKTITVTGDEAIAMSKKLSREAGLLVGISSGANVCAALKMAEQITGKIVTVLPDTAERYLSTALFEEY